MEKEDWRSRLDAALKARDLSMNAVSIDADLSSGYLHGILKDGKSPSIDNLIAVCNVVGISITSIVSGIEMTQIQEKFLRLLADLDQEDQENLLKVLERVRAGAVRT